jgi:hypothetical protein
VKTIPPYMPTQRRHHRRRWRSVPPIQLGNERMVVGAGAFRSHRCAMGWASTGRHRAMHMCNAFKYPLHLSQSHWDERLGSGSPPSRESPHQPERGGTERRLNASDRLCNGITGAGSMIRELQLMFRPCGSINAGRIRKAPAWNSNRFQLRSGAIDLIRVWSSECERIVIL